MTLKKKGRATITATAYNGVSAKLSVSVKAAPKSIQLKLERSELGVGEAVRFSASFPKDSAGTYTLESDNPAVAIIDGDAVIGVAPGSAKLTAKTYNGKKSTKTITVRSAPESVSFERDELALGVGESRLLSAAVNAGSAGAIRYFTDGDCVDVDASGKILALYEGEATVFAETYNGVTGECRVMVLPAPTQLRLAAADERTKFGVGEKVPLICESDSAAAGISYKSSNKKVAAVSADGLLTLKKKGRATITATTYNGVSAKLSINVQPAPKSIRLKLERSELGVGEEIGVAATFPKGSAGGYEISVEGDAARYQDGRIIAVAPGEALICARSFNGRSAQTLLTVRPEPEWLALAPEEGKVTVGGELRLAVEMNPGAMSAVRFESADERIATVNADGVVTGLALGDTVITATAINGVSARIVLQVLPKPERIYLAELLEIGVGDRYPLLPELYPLDSLGSFSYASSDTRVAKIDKNGMISAYAVGNAVITVRCGDCVETCILIVRNYADLHPVRAVAHRGVSGYYPENTLEAFRHVPDYGAREVEFDVRKTADGKLIVFHNPTIGTGDDMQFIDSMTYEQLKALKPDVCLLSEALKVIGECGLYAHVEIKDSNIESEVAECVKQSPVYGSVNYLCFDLNVLRTISAHDPDAELNYLVNKKDNLNYLMKNLSKFKDIEIVSIRKDLLTPEIVRTLHLNGKKVTGWTADTESDIKRLKKMGVDYITTNYPDRVK